LAVRLWTSISPCIMHCSLILLLIFCIPPPLDCKPQESRNTVYFTCSMLKIPNSINICWTNNFLLSCSCLLSQTLFMIHVSEICSISSVYFIESFGL
jgi:hypothetical protein